MNELGLGFSRWLMEHRTAEGEAFFLRVTEGGELFWLMTVLGVLFWLFGAKWAYRVGLALFLGDWLNGMVKNIFCIPRPWVRDEAIVPNSTARWGAFGYSFPSGHSSSTMTLWGGMAAAVRKIWLWPIAVVWIALLGCSRVYLGVHTWVDVAGAWTLGVLAIWGAMRLAGWMREYPRWAGAIKAGILLVAIGGWLLLRWLSQFESLGISVGRDLPRTIWALGAFLFAWHIERAHIQYDPKRLGIYRILAVVLGAFVMSLIQGHLRPLLNPLIGENGAVFAVSALLPLWIFAIWPFLLRGLELQERG